MPARDLGRWRVYFRHRPRFDPWWAMARVCSVVVAALGGKAKLKDFYPRVEVVRNRRRRAATPEQTAAAADRMFLGRG